MAASANVDAAFGHIVLIKIFSKPLVAMAGLRYQVMECNKMFASAKHTGFVQLVPPAKNITWQSSDAAFRSKGMKPST